MKGIYSDGQFSDNIVNCFKCVHFAITWDEKMPYGCKAMQFKTKILPSIEVYKSSGEKCMLFESK